MNNPNNEYHCAGKGSGFDPALDPNFDWWPWLLNFDYRLDHDHVRETAIRRWLEDAGFEDIRVTRVPERGPDAWQIILRRGVNQERPTVREVERQVCALAVDLRCLPRERPCALVWGDNIGVGLRLLPVDRNDAEGDLG